MFSAGVAPNSVAVKASSPAAAPVNGIVSRLVFPSASSDSSKDSRDCSVGRSILNTSYINKMGSITHDSCNNKRPALGHTCVSSLISLT